jgi:tetratricopeptide (TPR) repeat protein
MEGKMGALDRGCAVVLTAVFCWAALGSLARADWAACQSKPTRSCILEEALRGESGPLGGKERLDVLLQANVLNHLEYATTADIKEAQRLAKDPSGSPYLALAIRSLVAADQWQDAFDLVASSKPEIRSVTFGALTRALVKAGHQDRIMVLLTRMTPPVDPGYVMAQWAGALVEAGKIDDAVALIGEAQGHIADLSTAEMLTAVAQAYAKRGDTKLAGQFFDKAQATLQAGLQKPAATGQYDVRQYDPISLRFHLISLLALRGDTAAVKTALQQLAPPANGPAVDRAAEAFRMAGYRRVVLALLQDKQFSLALEVAKSMPGSAAYDRDSALASIALAYAANGRIDDARALLSSLGDKTNAKIRTSVVGGLAVALAKAGNVPSALQTAAQIGDLTSRKATLFAIAQTLPP